MPAHRDLTGMKFGDLTVVKLIKHVPSSERKMASIWRIKCKCGRVEDMRQLWIPYCKSNKLRRSARYGCTVCFRGPCEICGSEILTDSFIGVCSPQCQHERQKANDRNHYYRMVAKDPDFNKKVYEKKRRDPKTVERMRGYDRKRYNKRRSDPDYLKKEKSRLKKYYWENREEILEKRRGRWNNLTLIEQAQIRQRDRERHRAWYYENAEKIQEKRRRARMAMSADEKKALRAKHREYYRNARRERQLNELFKIGEALNDKLNNT